MTAPSPRAGRPVLVLLAARQPEQPALARLVTAAHDGGRQVLLLTLQLPATGPAADPASGPGSDPAPDLVHDLRAAAIGHGPGFRRSLRDASPSQRFVLHLHHDHWLEQWLDEHRGVPVEVVVLDDAAKDGAEWLRGALAERPARRDRPRRALLRNVLTGLPGRPRTRSPAGALAHVRELARSGAHDRAAALARRAAGATRDLRTRADLLGEAAGPALALGDGTLLAETAAAELAVADAHLARGQVREAAAAFGEALRTAFAPSVHFDSLSSPLAAHPESFTKPFVDSITARAVRLPAALDRTRPDPVVGRPTRVLFLVRGTESFALPVREHLAALDRAEVRYRSVARLPGLRRFVDSPADFAEQVLGEDETMVRAAADLLGDDLAWADVVWVEWCAQLAALVSRLDPGSTRVVVRCHAYEPFTRSPQLTDFSRVDDVVFVSEHLRRFTLAAVPGLRESTHTRVHVLPNAMDLSAMLRPKDDDARFTLALVGASKIVKDPRWAIEVLRLLRAHDPRYRLQLIGGRFQGSAPAVREYAAALAADLAELEPVDAVRRISFTDDIPAALQQVGVILSTSVRESFHLGLAEGAASGAVPVVRDWPFFPGAAAEIFGEDWVVDTPQQAAERVLELTADTERWCAAGLAASQRVRSRWDWPLVRAGYEELLLGRPEDGG